MRIPFPPVRALASLAATALLAASASLSPASAQAQQWPDKPVRVIAAGTAGATADLVARTIAEGLTASLGKPFVVEPKPGGLGGIAVGEMLRAPHDGYTLMVGVNAIVSEIPHSIKFPFDPAKDIRPVAELVRGGLVLVGHPSIPANTLPELVKWIKSQPKGVSYASYSPGTLSHVMGLQLANAAGLELTHVGYRGSSPALQDVMANQVPLMFDGMVTSIPQIKAGKLKAFAVSSPQRSSVLPDVPTLAESRFPQLTAVGWIGLWLPTDVPQAVQDKLRAETLKVLQQPAVRERFAQLGQDIGQPLTSEQMTRSLAADYERVGAILKSIDYKPQQ